MKTASYRLPKRYKNSVSSYAYIITSYYTCFTIEGNIIHFRIGYRPLNAFCDDFKFTFFLNEDLYTRKSIELTKELFWFVVFLGPVYPKRNAPT